MTVFDETFRTKLAKAEKAQAEAEKALAEAQEAKASPEKLVRLQDAVIKAVKSTLELTSQKPVEKEEQKPSSFRHFSGGP